MINLPCTRALIAAGAALALAVPAHAQTNTSFATALNFTFTGLNTASASGTVGASLAPLYYVVDLVGPGQIGTVGAGQTDFTRSGTAGGTITLYPPSGSGAVPFSDPNALGKGVGPLDSGPYFLVYAPAQGGTYQLSVFDDPRTVVANSVTPDSRYGNYPQAAAVPEPAPAWLLAAGLLPLALMGARRRTRR